MPYEWTSTKIPYGRTTGNIDIFTIGLSANRSGFIRVSVADEVEDEAVIFPRPELREGRRLSEKIKLACARTCIASQCSAEQARKAIQVILRELYRHEYYLTAQEQYENEGALSHQKPCHIPLMSGTITSLCYLVLRLLIVI